MADWSQIQQGIFRGESGGDYGALFGYQNRPGGKFADIDLTKMTIDEALEFANPSGNYGQFVKGQVGRVATPMGAYQVVGSTLRDAKKGLGFSGQETMSPEVQDEIGKWIYKTQGTGAWEGYKPLSEDQAIASQTMQVLGKSPKGLLAPTQTSGTETKPMIQQQKPRGLLEGLGIQKMVEGAEGDAGQRFYNRQSFGDTMAALAPALGRMGVMGLDVPAQAVADRRFAQRDQEQKTSKTIEALSRMNTPQAKEALEYLSAGGDPVTALKMGFDKPGDAPSAFQALAYQARAAGLQEGTPEYQEFMLSGGGAPATYRALKMQAEAAGFQEGTPEFQEFMATRGAGLQAGARQTATNVANVATGGEAAQAIAEGTATGQKAVQEGSELNEMQRNIQGLRVTIDQLSALSDAATYTALGQVGNEIRKQLGLDPSEGAVARTEYIAVVNNQILPLLKETFGAAFTAAEGDTLRETLGDPNKTPAEKKVVLNAFIAQKERDLAARQGGPTSSAPSATGGDDPLGLRD